MSTLWDEFLDKLSHSLVEHFYKAVDGWIVYHWRHFRFWSYCKISKTPGWRIEVHCRGQFVEVRQSGKLRVTWRIWSRLMFLLPSGDDFRSFGEVVSYGQDEPMSFRYWRADGSNDIHSPHLEWPWRKRWMKMSRCLVDEVTMDLTGVTLFSIGDSVRNHFRSIVVKSSKSVSKLGSCWWAPHVLLWASLSASCSSLCERQRSRIPSYDRRYNVRMIAL